MGRLAAGFGVAALLGEEQGGAVAVRRGPSLAGPGCRSVGEALGHQAFEHPVDDRSADGGGQVGPLRGFVEWADPEDVLGEEGERAVHPRLQPGGRELAVKDVEVDVGQVAVEPCQGRPGPILLHLDATVDHDVRVSESIHGVRTTTDRGGEVVLLGGCRFVAVEGVGERGHVVEPVGGEPLELVEFGTVAGQRFELGEEQAGHRSVAGAPEVAAGLDQDDPLAGRGERGEEGVVLPSGVVVTGGKAGLRRDPSGVGEQGVDRSPGGQGALGEANHDHEVGVESDGPIDPDHMDADAGSPGASDRSPEFGNQGVPEALFRGSGFDVVQFGEGVEDRPDLIEGEDLVGRPVLSDSGPAEVITHQAAYPPAATGPRGVVG